MLGKEEEVAGIKLSERTRGTVYYDIPLKEQYVLFTVLVDVLSSRGKLKRFIVDNGLQKTELTRDFEDYPFWYKEFVDRCSGEGYVPTLKEIEEVVKYLHKRGLDINWKNLRKVTGRFLDSRKRKDISFLLMRSKYEYNP
jgi:hypothetical protein